MFGAIGKAIGGIGNAIGNVVEDLDLDLETIVGLGMGIATGNPLQIGYYAMDVLDGDDDAIVGQFDQFMPLASLAMGNPAGASGLFGAGEAGALANLVAGGDGADLAGLLGAFAGESDAVEGFGVFAELLVSIDDTDTRWLAQLLAA